MAHSILRRPVVVLLTLLIGIAALALYRAAPAAHAQTREFFSSGAITVGNTYEMKFIGNEGRTRYVVKRIVQGWIEVDAWTADPVRAPMQRIPRRWLNTEALEYIQEVGEER